MSTAENRTATAGTFINLEQLEDLARPLLPKQVFDYYAGAAEREQTLHDNRTSYTDMYRLIPRVLVDVSLVDTSTMLFGTRLAFPVLIAPMAFQQMAHPEGELAVARAARAAGTSMIVSTMATISLQDIANDPNTDNMWFQVYVLKERRYTQHMVEEAERMGYKAIVVTVDAPVLGKRERDITNRFALPKHLQAANLSIMRDAAPTHQLRGGGGDSQAAHDGSGLEATFASHIDDALTWDCIAWLKSITTLPVLIKGLLHPKDAILAVHHGVDGIIVSNHGGRQVDGVVTALTVLPHIVKIARGHNIPVIVDGSIRRGTDVYKCIALGASAVLLGRPALYALAVDGQAGVVRALDLLHKELANTMAMMGTPRLCDITHESLWDMGESSSLGGGWSATLGQSTDVRR